MTNLQNKTNKETFEGGFLYTYYLVNFTNDETNESHCLRKEDVKKLTLEEFMEESEFDIVIDNIEFEVKDDEYVYGLEAWNKLSRQEKIDKILFFVNEQDDCEPNHIEWYDNEEELNKAYNDIIQEIETFEKEVEEGKYIFEGREIFSDDLYHDVYMYNEAYEEDYSDEEYTFQTINAGDEELHETYVTIVYDKERYIETGDVYVNGTKVFGYAHNSNYRKYYFFEPCDINIANKEEIKSLRDKYKDNLDVFKFKSIKEAKEFINKELEELKEYNDDITANKLIRKCEYDRYDGYIKSGYYYI